MTKKPGISQCAFAKLQGVTPRAVQKAVKSGRLDRSLTDDGRIKDVALAHQEWADNGDERKHRDPPAPAGETTTFQKANAIIAMYKAKMAKLEHDEAVGLLIRVEEVKVIFFNASRKVRDDFQSLPDRLAAVIADRPRDEVYPLLKKEIDRALTEFADTMAK